MFVSFLKLLHFLTYSSTESRKIDHLDTLRSLSDLIASFNSTYRISPKLDLPFPKHTISPMSFPSILSSLFIIYDSQTLENAQVSILLTFFFFHSLGFNSQTGDMKFMLHFPDPCVLQQKSPYNPNHMLIIISTRIKGLLSSYILWGERNVTPNY